MLSPARAIKAESTTLRRAGGVGALPYRRCSTGNVRGSPIGSLRGVGIVVVPVQPLQTPAHRRLFLNVVIHLHFLRFHAVVAEETDATSQKPISTLPRNPIQISARLGSSYKIYPAVTTMHRSENPVHNHVQSPPAGRLAYGSATWWSRTYPPAAAAGSFPNIEKPPGVVNRFGGRGGGGGGDDSDVIRDC